MPDLPYMAMNWGRFFTDSKVAALTGEAQGIYACLLGRMWLNQGWLKADDKLIARLLGLDVRVWRSRFKPQIEPLLRREKEPHVGDIYTQKHLQEVRARAIATVEKMQARTAPARAAKAAKARKAPSVTEPKAEPVTKSATETVTEPVTAPETTGKRKGKGETTSPVTLEPRLSAAGRAAALTSSAVPPPHHVSTAGALPPREGLANGDVAHSAHGRSPSLKGGSLPAPSPALLKSKLVNTPLDDDEDDTRRRDHVGNSLFGALEAAIRHGKSEDE